MAKFKKLAMLCTALLATATMAAGCELPFLGGNTSNDSLDNSESSVSESVVDSSIEESSSEVEEESSSEVEEESSSEVEEESSSEEEEVETSYYELVVDGTEVSFTATSWNSVWDKITFTVEEAGTYGIYAVDASFNEAGVEFGASDETDSSNVSTKYIFDVEEAGDVTLATYYFSYADCTVTYNYYVYKLNTLEVSAEAGTAELCANLPVPVKAIAPAAGKYVLSLTNSVVWADDMADLASGGENATKKEFTFTEAGEEITVYVVYENLDEEAFDFEWTFAEKFIPALTVGDNTLTLPANEVVEVTFTSTVDEAYTISATNDDIMFGVWTADYGGYIDYSVSDYGNSYIFVAQENVACTIYVRYSNYDDPTAIKETINVSKFESDNPSALALGDNSFVATTEGVTATFTASVAGTYNISDGYNTSMWFTDTVDSGVSYEDVTLAAGESVSFTVKYDGIITINVEKLPEVVYIDADNTTTNIPEGENTLEFNVSTGEYTLVWDNDNVIVKVNGMAYEEGTKLSVSYWSSYSITSTDGSAIENVTFTLAEFVYPTVALGDNTINADVSEITYKFTATEPGCYVFTLTGEKIDYVSVDSNSAITYPSSLDAAGEISINVKANAEISLVVSATEACEITVNVACSTTIVALETAVTMNEDGTAPESLTIASLPAGACVYYSVTTVQGDYVVTWTADSLTVYAGTEVGMSYDPEVRLTRTALDGILYVIVKNYGDTDLTNVVLNIAIYEEPAAEAQGTVVTLGVETTISISSYSYEIISFIAPSAGTYTLTTASSITVDLWVNGDWGYDRAWNAMIDSETGGSYTFTLEEGGIIDFFVMEYNYGAVDFVFTITQAE